MFNLSKSKTMNFIWAFNGVAIFVISIISICSMAWIFYGEVIRDRDQHIQNHIEIDLVENSDDSEKWSLGYMQTLQKTPYAIIPLTSDKKELDVKRNLDTKVYNMFSGGYSRTPTRNILFINTETNEQQWLFSTNDRYIESTVQLSDNDNYNSKSEVLGLLYSIAETDTNNDQKINSDDSFSIAITDASGKNYTVLLSDIDDIIGRTSVKNDQILIFYRKSKTVYSAIVNIKDFTVTDNKETPKI